jgi:hypothetical protein
MQQQQTPPGKLLYIIDIPGMIYVLWIFNTTFIQHVVKPECVGSFNMDWWILVFYPEPEARDKIY